MNQGSMLTKEAFKTPRFRIWVTSLLLVVVSGTVFGVRVEKSSSKFLSVNFVRTNEPGSDTERISISVSNRMPFSVDYWTTGEELRRGEWTRLFSSSHWGSSTLAARSQTNRDFRLPDGVRMLVCYERQLTPAELLVVDTFPWLKRHYPFHRLRSSIYRWNESEAGK